MKDPLELGDRLGHLVGTVRAGNDELGLGMVKVGAPVRDTPVAAVGGVALAAVAKSTATDIRLAAIKDSQTHSQ